ncbi:hypothetical protein GCM10022200_10380 [Microbacterium awajiense]|uniref:Uncharacterized protein n=1 Tax=Microbacterium awajiense TaxID=415214 RepID=A0ABP7ACY5_9MICO
MFARPNASSTAGYREVSASARSSSRSAAYSVIRNAAAISSRKDRSAISIDAPYVTPVTANRRITPTASIRSAAIVATAASASSSIVNPLNVSGAYASSNAMPEKLPIPRL